MKNTLLKWAWAFMVCLFLFPACNDHEANASSSDSGTSYSEPIQQNQEEARRKQNEAYKEAITTLLQQDAAIDSVSQDYTAVARRMRQIDRSACPGDFAAAYVDHIHAWEYQAQIQRALSYIHSDDVSQKAFVKSILEKILGSDHTDMDDLAVQEQALNQSKEEARDKVHTTYNEVEHIAALYGANLAKRM